jgi:methyl-accepting chemotaxis protein
MKVFDSMRVSTRMTLLVGLALVGLLVLSFLALLQIRNSMLEDRKQDTKHLVQVGIGILTQYHKMAQEGKISEEDAKATALNTFRGLRYGNNDYFYIYDSKGMSVMHPIRKDFEGQSKWDLKDGKGKLLIQDILAVGKQPGGGFSEFWFARAGSDVQVPKIGYSATFAPWDMVVGTGVYVDDIDQAFRKNALMFGSIFLALLGVLGLVGGIVSSSVLRHLGGEPHDAADSMKKIANGDLGIEIHLKKGDNSSLMASLKLMQMKLSNLTSAIQENAHTLSDQVQGFDGVAKRYSETRQDEDLFELNRTIKKIGKTAEFLGKSISRFKL